MSDDKKLLAAAKAGNIDKIYDLVESADGGGDDEDDDDGGTEETDDLAFKWLLVAADFGHKKAAEAADDMLETSSLRYDDGGMVQGLVHLELGEAYLVGDDGLAVDHALAKQHLETARDLEVHVSTDVAKDFDKLRKKLTPAALAVFDAVFPAKKAKPTKSTKKPTKPTPPKRPV